MIEQQEGRFQGALGWELFRQSWLPSGERRAAIVIIHGLGEHSGRYPQLIETLVPQGYALYSFDHRGHGRSPDRQCAHVNDWGEYRTDVGALVAAVRQEQPELPLFLYGHSMGGLITLNYALHHPESLQGVIASAPLLAEPEVPPLLRFAARALSRWRPETELASDLDATGISRDPEVVAAYERDPLVHGKISARWATCMLETIEQTHAQAATFSPPLLLLHGDADALVPIAGSHRFLAAVAHEDKQLQVYPGGFHEPHNDIQKEQVMADVSDWLAAHH